MKTKYFFLAAAAALFAACSSDDGIAEQQQQAKQQAEQVPVAFDAYTNRGTTRAGLTGELTDDAASLRTSGFGVFAYYTNADIYDPSSFMPNFMYNQRVTYSSGWTYAPLKYWPNEFGANARSEDVDKISFFAYAPYVTVNTSSGKVQNPDPATYPDDDGEGTMGIVGMTRNNVTGDPMVKYISTFYTDEQVDLVWGTIPSSQKWTKKNDATAEEVALTEGEPWVNVEHPYQTSVNAKSKVKFQFLHSLASLNIQVDTKVNSTETSSVKDDIGKTKVYIRSVTFEGFDTKGALNLNNTTPKVPLWYNFNCNDELNNGSEITIKDGRKDGKEGINAATSEYAAINPEFVQNGVFGTTGEPAGVTGTTANLFCKFDKTEADDITDPIFVIPNDDPLKVTIEYDVLTKDDNLVGKLNDGQTKGSVVKNVITRYITTTGAGDPADKDAAMVLKNGKKYTINLHLGLNSVEFDAAVTNWDPTDASGGADLPHNNPSSAKRR